MVAVVKVVFLSILVLINKSTKILANISGASPESELSKNHSAAFRLWWNSLLDNYDSRLRPYFGEHPLEIKIGLTVLAISSFSEATMDWTIEMYFHEYWHDPRLIFNGSDFGVKDVLTLPQDAPDKLWTPDTSFINALRCQVPERGSVSHLALLRVYENGLLFSARRISVTASCHMKLTMYPFDQQACTLELSSYGHTEEDIVYKWNGGHKAINFLNITLPDFTATQNSSRIIRKRYVAGNYSVPQLCLVFVRSAGFCFLQLFIPATSVVAASWISLWLENETQFADIVSIILAILFLSYSYNTVMPKVSYIKAMDIYLGACFIFAFLSMAKLAIVKYMGKKVEKREKRKLIEDIEKSVIDNGSLAESIGCPQRPIPAPLRRKMTTVSIRSLNARGNKDKIWVALKVFHIGSQLVLPLAFLAFALFYFFIYPHVINDYGTCFKSEP